MHKILTRLTIAVFACASFASHAAWVTADGKASLANQDAQSARTEAINDAIRSVLMQSGATIEADQSTEVGMTGVARYKSQTRRIIKSVTVMSEEMTDNSIKVTIRAFVDADKITRCRSSDIKKVVLPVKLQFLDQHAYRGSAGMDDINEEMSNMLYTNLSEASTLMIKPRVNKVIHLASDSNVLSSDMQKNLSSLAQYSKAQYVLYGAIRSVAPSDVGSNPLTKALYSKTRTIDFSLTVYDAYHNDIIYSKHFNAETDWEYRQGEFIDVRSNRFRNSAYGSRLRQLIRNASDEIVGLIQCRSAEAVIINVLGDDIIINQGKLSNINEGDFFDIRHRSTFMGSDNIEYVGHDPNSYRYRVSASYPDSAKLVPVDLNNALVTPRVNDIVIATSPAVLAAEAAAEAAALQQSLQPQPAAAVQTAPPPAAAAAH